MLRVSGLLAAAVVALWPPRSRPALSGRAPGSLDVRDLIAAARGAPASLCMLAAEAVGNGWHHWGDAPATPLPRPGDGASGRERRDPLPSTDVRFLLESLGVSDPCVRELAVRLLGREETEEVALGLEARLIAPDSATRVVAAFGLGLTEPMRSVDPLVRATRDESPGVRANAVWALGRIGDGRGLRPATSALGDGSALVRQAAAGALGHFDSLSAVPALTRILGSDPVSSVRRTAAWALAELEAKSATEALAAALHGDKDPGVREMSAWALGELEVRPAPASLMQAARSDADGSVRETALWALGQLGDNTAADLLGQVVSSDPDPRARATAAWALGQLDIHSAPKGLIDALSDSDAGLRVKAAWALSQIGDGAAVPALRTALSKEQDARARKAEIRALIHSGERADRLTELLESKDPQVREAAIRGLAGHGGVDPWPWPQPRPRPFP
jgi:HEAT repeat protein